MKKYLLLLLLVAAGKAGAQVVSFADPQLKAYLLTSNSINSIAQINLQSVKIDANSDGQIQVAEAQAIDRLWINSELITDLQGIAAFSNLNELGIQSVSVPAISLSGMLQLERLQTDTCFAMTSLSISNMPLLEQLSCTNNLQLASISFASCPALTHLFVMDNSLTALDVSMLPALLQFYCNGNQLASLNVSGCGNLQEINCSANQLTALNVSGLEQLQYINADDNPALGLLNASGCTALASSFNVSLLNDTNLQAIDFSGCTQLSTVQISNTAMASLNVSGCSSLASVLVGNNQLSSLALTGCTALTQLNCNNNDLLALDVTACPNLQELYCDHNQIASLNITGCTALEILNGAFNPIGTLDVSGYLNLSQLVLSDTAVTSLDVSGCVALTDLFLPKTLVTADISNCTALGSVSIFDTASLQSLNVQGCTALTQLAIIGNEATPAPISTINLSGLTNLQNVTATFLSLTSVNFANCPAIVSLMLAYNPLANLDLEPIQDLQVLSLGHTLIDVVDVSAFHSLASLDLSHCAQLTAVFAKNGSNESIFLDTANTALEFICQDEATAGTLQDYVASLGLSTVCNTYCSFTPGGDYNSISGVVRFDADGNGCDNNDILAADIRLDITDGSENYSTFMDYSGQYHFFTGPGNFTVSPAVENPSIFSFSPENAVIPFPDNANNSATQDFCLAAIGTHNDVEIVIAPIAKARPGYATGYQLVIRNKGNQTLSGSFNLAYNDNLMDFVVATLAPNSQSSDILNWNYSNLKPFENRSLYTIFNVNSPTQAPPVNIGDMLQFTATVSPIIGDDLPLDNQFALSQEVVGSFDPNDITCLEGQNAAPSEIGNYLHYIVNFENTGTAEAENIVVKIMVDTDQYDLGSLQLLNASAASTTRIHGNTVEFIFQDINLAAAAGSPPVGGHGNVLFKIKSKNNLNVGDSVQKKANIFFDYNAPITTNTAETVYATLGNTTEEPDSSVTVYPNPTRSAVNIKCDSVIRSVALYDIGGRIIQASLPGSQNASLDLSGTATGIYFVKVITDKGVKAERLIKQ